MRLDSRFKVMRRPFVLGKLCESFDSSTRGHSSSFHAKDGLSREAAALLRILGSLRLLRGAPFYPGTVLGVDQRSIVSTCNLHSSLALIGVKPLRALFG